MICHVCRLISYHLIGGEYSWPDGSPIDRCERCVKHNRTLPEDEIQKFVEWNSRPGPSTGKESFEYFLESLGRKPEGWRALMKYPNSVRPTFTLDTLEELVPIPPLDPWRGQVGAFNDWLSKAEEMGLLIKHEKLQIQIAVGPNL